MKQCLNCNKEFEAQRPHAKFCSDKCRASYNRKHPNQTIAKWQLQSLYNAILEAVDKIQYATPKEVYNSPKKPYIQDEPLSFDKLKKELVNNQPLNWEQKLYSASTAEDLQKYYHEIEKSSLSFREKQRLHNIGKQIFNDKFNF